MARKIENFPASDMRLWLVEFDTLFRIQIQNYVSLDIKKRKDQALISISTILKFPARNSLPQPVSWWLGQPQTF